LPLAKELALWKYGFMKTTLEIPDPIFKRAKARAAMEGIKLKDLVAAALAGYLARPKGDAPTGPGVCPFPLVSGKGGPLLKHLDHETIAHLQEEEDLESYRRSIGR
jgi:hypothetical protein